MKTRLFITGTMTAALILVGADYTEAAEDGEESTSRWEQLKALYHEKLGSADQSDTTDSNLSDKIEAIKAYYRESKESTTEMSKEAYQWLQDDIAKIGAWEYQVYTAGDIEGQETHDTLTQMGQARWELVSAVANDDRVVFVLKRPMKSYVKVLPAEDVLKMMGDVSPKIEE